MRKIITVLLCVCLSAPVFNIPARADGGTKKHGSAEKRIYNLICMSWERIRSAEHNLSHNLASLATENRMVPVGMDSYEPYFRQAVTEMAQAASLLADAQKMMEDINIEASSSDLHYLYNEAISAIGANAGNFSGLLQYRHNMFLSPEDLLGLSAEIVAEMDYYGEVRQNFHTFVGEADFFTPFDYLSALRLTKAKLDELKIFKPHVETMFAQNGMPPVLVIQEVGELLAEASRLRSLSIKGVRALRESMQTQKGALKYAVSHGKYEAVDTLLDEASALKGNMRELLGLQSRYTKELGGFFKSNYYKEYLALLKTPGVTSGAVWQWIAGNNALVSQPDIPAPGMLPPDIIPASRQLPARTPPSQSAANSGKPRGGKTSGGKAGGLFIVGFMLGLSVLDAVNSAQNAGAAKEEFARNSALEALWENNVKEAFIADYNAAPASAAVLYYVLGTEAEAAIAWEIMQRRDGTVPVLDETIAFEIEKIKENWALVLENPELTKEIYQMLVLCAEMDELAEELASEPQHRFMMDRTTRSINPEWIKG